MNTTLAPDPVRGKPSPTRRQLLRLFWNHPGNIPYLFQYFRLRDAHPIDARLPWMTFPAIRYLQRIARAHTRVFEWGSGGSTVFFLDRGAVVHSVEHDPAWAAKVKSAVASMATGFQYFLQPPNDSTALPVIHSQRHKGSGSNFRDYVSVIDAYSDESFDLVCIDGRVRNECAAHAVAKVKTGGFLVLDNSDRIDYAPAIALLSSWRVRHFVGLGPGSRTPWRTSIWQKPSEPEYTE